ncbi:hypothetical protein CYMTET_30507, partial [Cymbomonas tetramitiformis]
MGSSWVHDFCIVPDLSSNKWDKFPFGTYTSCFQDVAILGVVYVCMIVCVAFRVHILRRGQYETFRLVKVGVHNAQLFLSAVLSVMPLMQLGGVLESNKDHDVDSSSYFGGKAAPFKYVNTILAGCAWATVLASLIMERTHGYKKAGRWVYPFLFCFAFACHCIKLYFVVVFSNGHYDYFVYFYIVQYLSCILLVVTSAFQTPNSALVPWVSLEQLHDIAGYAPLSDSEDGPTCDKVCPEGEAGVLSRLTFSWLTPLIARGYQSALQEDDVWRLDEVDTVKHLRMLFGEAWTKHAQVEYKWKKMRLLSVLWSCFRGRIFLGFIFKNFNDASQFVGPTFLQLLIKYTESDSIPASSGYIYAFSIFVGSMIGALAEAQYFQYMMRV